jgi:hypothetical protein
MTIILSCTVVATRYFLAIISICSPITIRARAWHTVLNHFTAVDSVGYGGFAFLDVVHKLNLAGFLVLLLAQVGVL